MIDWPDKFAGTLLGTAVGDAIGLPREGLSPLRARRLFGDAPLGHGLVFRRGMISDDTEHACMTAQALLASGGDPEAFAHSLAWRLRGWLLGIPAGIGFGTLRAILKLWLGFGPQHSGVYSAGNGPAMRAPILGVWAAATGLAPKATAALVRASTRLTHTDPRATEGALVIALAAAHGATTGPTGLNAAELIAHLQDQVHGEELRANLQQVASHLARGTATREFVAALGLSRGISGYINHTVPVALCCWLRWPTDFRTAVENAVLAGGDTDTTAAIVGGLSGATLGVHAIPQSWIDGLWEWPRSASWIKTLAERLAEHSQSTLVVSPGKPLSLFWPGLALRNPLFITVVLAHGFRRLFPPY
jgi:ADP-ribosyl-[dinitrogen reductase] hydrolase